jgi:hypothetical protein
MITINFNPKLIYSLDQEGLAAFLSKRTYTQRLELIVDSSDSELSQLNSLAVAVKAVIATVMGASLLSQAVM